MMIGSLVDYDEFSSESEEENSQTSAQATTKPANSCSIPAAPSNHDKVLESSASTSREGFEVNGKSSPVAGSSKFNVEEDEVEVDLRMRLPGNLKKSDIMKPPPRRRKKGKVTITAFQLSDGSDSDEADSKKAAPRTNKTASRQGLASLLPAPQALIVREGNKPMIPHTVTRRNAAPSTAALKAKPAAVEAAPEPGVPKMKSFFTLDDDEDEPMQISNLAPQPIGSETVGPKRPTVATMESYPALPEPMVSDDRCLPDDILPESERRLQRKRRLEPASGIIEIRQDELTAGAEIEFTKTISQEEDDFAKKRHADNMPSKMAARKHQITWLAYRAKEQEFELKNSWATAKFNKNQTRNKYGF